MQIFPLKTPIMKQGDDLYLFLDKLDFDIKEEDILIITSKLFSYHHKLFFPKTQSKEELIKKESEQGPWKSTPTQVPLGVRHKAFLPFSGVDESNGNGMYLSLPQDPFKDAKELHSYLKKRFHLQKLGVIIVDSALLPLRSGTTAISLGFYGIKPLKTYKGKKDLFGEELKLTQVNIVDSIVPFANLYMGEADEAKPLVVFRDLNVELEFLEESYSKEFFISPSQDVFSSFFR